MSKRIYIAYTGGTIGMKKSAEGYVPVAGYLQQKLAKLSEFQRPEMPKYEIHEYQPLIDSSDCTPQDWQVMANDIAQHYDEYDGFVILHGTDTMAYTASALSFLLQGLQKPVIITGSQIPLAQLRSDGQQNLLNALYIAANYSISEVSLFFNNQLFRGNRTTKVHSEGFNAFASPNYPPLLTAGIHIEQHIHATTDRSTWVAIGTQSFCCYQMTQQPIAVVMLYPGIDFNIIKNALNQPVKALILLTFGSGNASQNSEFLTILADANKQGIILLNLTQCLVGHVDMNNYATGRALLDAGVISGYDLTPEAALAKLHFLLSQDFTLDEIKSKLVQNLCGELSTTMRYN